MSAGLSQNQRSTGGHRPPLQWTRRGVILGLLLLALLPIRGLPQNQRNQPPFTLRTDTELVLVNVTVRYKDGNFVRDLKLEDFALAEDGKPEKLLSVDVENTDALKTAAPATQG